ncbi:5'-methylthioadenosine/S-adenosylhomocysteine nucleosidase [Bifidobacterium sp. ESL0745]|uniref:5'-methylthioadenosine/S-adenosylhomocysteine nucleosidase n=1 Tax=Bifidobacterium sp. ESL0745 TaxID=2983226 RepID=UPI0023F6835B|nr:5'-methylthioadenosine/S-adenosylhomocysteine nucleosidase [Bifidobacterium sp. ESL0745]MDF7665440.1 5'-methylthioadenosine/S-adenosylhomocysteine nucleosidase [Bifidobacterium sp. ESL0745]
MNTENCVIAVQCALEREAELIVSKMDDAQTETILNNRVTTGSYKGVPLVVCVGGMGAANAASASQFIIDRYTPKALIFSGIAGSINPGLAVGDILICAEQHYAETNTPIIAECPPYLEYFPSDKKLVEAAIESVEQTGFRRIPSQRELVGMPSSLVRDVRPERLDAESSVSGIAVGPGMQDQHYVVGNISTSDRFNTDPDVLKELVERFGAEGEAMEEAPAAQIAGKCGVPFLCIRGISNPCGEAYDDLNAHERNMQGAADNAGMVTLGVVSHIGR